ncbi:MAG TPA: EAL domain-containing protein [Burkholderiales bacterium]|nr:EAL domain-containing protein [Burkholderiales bacterium]
MTTQSIHQDPIALIVDDDAMMRLLLRETLEREGFRVEEAEHGAAGVALFAQIKPDVVLLDVMMPEMDGFTACAELRKLPHGLRLPILMMTGLDDVESIDRAYQAGGTDFITKPINWEVLGYRVRYMLRASQAFEELAKNESRLLDAQRVARLGYWDWDIAAGKVDWSDEVYALIGKKRGEMDATFESLVALVHRDDRESVRQAFVAALKDDASNATDCRITFADGSQHILNIQAKVTRDESGRAARMHGTIQDITERKDAEERIRCLAYYDSVTQLPNRVLFKEQLNRALAHAKRQRGYVAVMFLDLDHFKRINDTLGHSIGDLLLQGVAKQLVECVRGEDLVSRHGVEEVTNSVGRLGGDEFTLFLTEIQEAQDVGRVARRLLASLAKPFVLDGHEIFVTASIGIALFPSDGEDEETLLMNADTAMYHAKGQGRNNFHFYDKSMNAAAAQRLSLENDLRRALHRNEFYLHFQPQIDAATGKILGNEALLRWEHPERGQVPTSEFIPILEDSGLIVQIGEWVLKAACLQNKAWHDAGLPQVHISVNISGLHFRLKNLIQAVKEALAVSGLDPRWLELEVTEGVLMQDTAVTMEILASLDEMGVKVSIDDFGTGYSSLSYLKRFSPDSLKIDRSFVRDMLTDPDDGAITRSIIAMAHGLRLKVVAEGVETMEQLQFLQIHKCDAVQGFYFSKPVPADQIPEMLRNNSVPSPIVETDAVRLIKRAGVK